MALHVGYCDAAVCPQLGLEQKYHAYLRNMRITRLGPSVISTIRSLRGGKPTLSKPYLTSLIYVYAFRAFPPLTAA
jgi:hypothetical protein